ncbi:MAG: GDP-mannose 4,6-dehydratase [Chloroflexi bacterium]|nr:GDP-mannose 4,6-dehydratase [Chloroflexota bacterium]
MRVFITGVTGMVGSHLAEYILATHNVQLFATYRWRSRMDNLERLKRAGKLNLIGENSTISSAEGLANLIACQAVDGKLNLVEGDMMDAFSMQRIIGAVKPDRIFHLAAQSYVPGSWSAPTETLQRNIIGQVNIFEAVREAQIDPVIHIAGSSEEYGLVLPGETPIKETNPLRPLSPYAVSKVTQEMLALQYFHSYGLRTVVTRAFNHTGPRRGHVFVTSNLAKQIAEIEKELRSPVIYVGDVTSQRDWSDVRDVVRAYWLAAEMGEPGDVYNVGCGCARDVSMVLKILCSQARCAITVEQRAERMRPSDVKVLLADYSKFSKLTGWQPEIPFEKTLEDLLDYWRERC